MTENGSRDLSPGDFFESVQVRSDDRDTVVDALRRVLRSMGFAPVDPAALPPYEGPIEEEMEYEARRFLVGPALDGWVGILPSADLPEQLADQVQSPHLLAWWQARRGATATPLLWSHAMHIILCDELKGGS